MSRTRLTELVFRGGTASSMVRRGGHEPPWNESVRLTYEVRRATETESYEWSDNGWPRDIGVHGLFDVPLRRICFRTSSPEIKRYVEEDLDDMEENLADFEPWDTGVDKAGRTFQERIKVTLEYDGPEWVKEEAELDLWRARGKGREVAIQVGETTEDEEGGFAVW
jgi:hypothetical protein